MTGANEKLDKLLEDVAAMRENVEALEGQMAEMKRDLQPVFFQVAAIRFSGIVLGTLMAMAALFPSAVSLIIRTILAALLKGAA